MFDADTGFGTYSSTSLFSGEAPSITIIWTGSHFTLFGTAASTTWASWGAGCFLNCLWSLSMLFVLRFRLSSLLGLDSENAKLESFELKFIADMPLNVVSMQRGLPKEWFWMNLGFGRDNWNFRGVKYWHCSIKQYVAFTPSFTKQHQRILKLPCPVSGRYAPILDISYDILKDIFHCTGPLWEEFVHMPTHQDLGQWVLASCSI